MNQMSIQGDETAMKSAKTAAVRRWSTGRGIVAEVEPIQCVVDRSTLRRPVDLVQSASPTGRDIPVDRSTFGQNRKRSCHQLVEEHADRSPISRASVDQSFDPPPSTGRPREKNVSSPSDVTKSSLCF
ncbi:hypothetical protein M0R45_009493 [Rubus argutus]|uniref:Uncharacterized protein n=1 Tax=Rubus argutus TaxID=59490 RepID=A0AAW1Y7M2_RUBAR